MQIPQMREMHPFGMKITIVWSFFGTLILDQLPKNTPDLVMIKDQIEDKVLKGNLQKNKLFLIFLVADIMMCFFSED